MFGRELRISRMNEGARRYGTANDLKRVCSWCGKDMGMQKSPNIGITHGMCKACFERVMGEEKENPVL